jgi:hypothetical protein
VSARISRTGEDCTPRSRAASGGSGGLSTYIAGAYRSPRYVPPPSTGGGTPGRRVYPCGRPQCRPAGAAISLSSRAARSVRMAAHNATGAHNLRRRVADGAGTGRSASRRSAADAARPAAVPRTQRVPPRRRGRSAPRRGAADAARHAPPRRSAPRRR